VILDNFPGCGPLAGIEAALAASDAELHLFLPVDLPSLPVAFLSWMAQRAEVSGAAATLPLLAGRPQPLCAVYHRSLLPGLGGALAAGQYKVVPAIEAAARGSLDTFEIEALASVLIPAGWPAHPPVHDWFRNLNTPEDYERLRRTSRVTGANARDPIS
jgi:molybdenum cofactor guanylyltransferase